MPRHAVSMLFTLSLLVFTTPVAGASQPRTSAHVQTVIGSGTAASCQSEQARNNLGNAVAAGGIITFACGAVPVTMIVDTNATDQSVVVDGGGLITLSGEDLRQIFFVFGSGDLTLKNIHLLDGAGTAGAALAIASPLARATVKNSFLTSNDAGFSNGGAIYNQGTLLIEGSSIGSNLTSMNGGAIYNQGGQVIVRDSTLISNQALNGGAIYHHLGSVTVERSALRSNSSANQGGGLYVAAGIATVTNSTLYDNRGGGGGGIFMEGSQLIVTNATFNRNRADTGGALWAFAGQTRLKNTILANSRNTNDSAGSLNCDGPTAITEGRNIVSDGTCVPNPSFAGDLLSTDPQLDPFIRDNGGPTRSFMPLPGSPAVDYGLGCPPTDQRGVPRLIGQACDVGAVEQGWLALLSLTTR